MRLASYRTLLLTGALIATLAAAARAQSAAAFSSSAGLNLLAASGAQALAAPSGSTANPPRHSVDLAAMFSAEYARVALQSSNSFWMKGGAVDASFNLYRGLGAAVEFSGDTDGSVAPGASATKISFVAGPRYTVQFGGNNGSGRTSSIFVQGLGGVAHGFNGIYPNSSGVQSSASSGAVQVGGGYDLGIGDGWGIRLVEASWVRTMLPNSASDVQNDLRLSFGVTKRFGRGR